MASFFALLRFPPYNTDEERKRGDCMDLDLVLKPWDSLTGYLYERGQFRAADLIREIGGDRSLEWYFVPDPACESGELHILDQPCMDQVKDTEAAFPFNFDPTYCRYRLEKLRKYISPKNIAVCHKGDLFAPWIPDSVIREVFNAAEVHPEHTYFFLTRWPERYDEIYHNIKKSLFGALAGSDWELRKLNKIMIPMDYVVVGDRCTAAELGKLLAFSYTRPRAVCFSRDYAKAMPWSKDHLSSLAAVCKEADTPFYIAKHLHWKKVES